MRSILPTCLLLLLLHTVCAQLTVGSGGQLSFSGNAQLILMNTDLVNNGVFAAGTGKVSFTGGVPSNISGSQAIQFHELEINKTGGSKVLLGRPVGVDQQISFTAGYLDLNGYDADLGSTGVLQGEQESSRIVGSNGGQVIFSATLNAPSQANPGNLGMVISSPKNLGNTVIKRGHQSQGTSGVDSSVFRYYDITPANNTALNATLHFQYFVEELNGMNPNALLFQEKLVAQSWTILGSDVSSINPYYVEKSGVPALGLFTVSSLSSPLPVRFILFNAQCNDGSVLLTWKTAQEQNTRYFAVERSADGARWEDVGMVAAAGNSALESSYSFTDQAPAGKGYYRIAEYDLDGRAQFTQVLSTICSGRSEFKVWPNPVIDGLYISLTTGDAGTAVIKLFDGKGALVRQQVSSVLRGANLLSMDVTGIAEGVYFLSIVYDNGQVRMVQVMKGGH